MRQGVIYARLSDIILVAEFARREGSGLGGKLQQGAASESVGSDHSLSDDYLRESLREVGMREPLLVRQDGDRLVLVDGYRRVRQIRYLAEHSDLGQFIDPEAIPCYVQTEGNEPMSTTRLETNERRQDLPPSLQAKKFRELMSQHGRTIKQIAAMMGISAPSVSNYLVITKCIPEVQRAIDDRSLPMSAGKVFSILAGEGQRLLWQKVKGVRNITREQLWNRSRRLPQSYFLRSKATRDRMSASIRRAKSGQVQARGKTQTYLREDLTIVEQEVTYLQSELKMADRALEPWVRRWAIALRNKPIVDYLREHHSERLNEIQLIVELELGASGA